MAKQIRRDKEATVHYYNTQVDVETISSILHPIYNEEYEINDGKIVAIICEE